MAIQIQTTKHSTVFNYVKPSKNIPTTPKKIIKGNAVLIGMANVVHQYISTNTKLDDGGLLRAQVEIMKFGVVVVPWRGMVDSSEKGAMGVGEMG
jgi:hypothetical protein